MPDVFTIIALSSSPARESTSEGCREEALVSCLFGLLFCSYEALNSAFAGTLSVAGKSVIAIESSIPGEREMDLGAKRSQPK